MEEQTLLIGEHRMFNRRNFIMQCMLAVPVVGIGFRLWNLQVIRGDEYLKLAQNNHQRIEAIPGQRGIIYDQNLIVLAKNIPAYNAVLVRENVDVQQTLARLAKTLNIPLEPMLETMANNKRVAKFKPIQILENLSWQQVVLINAYQEEFPGVSTGYVSLRHYPFGKQFAHLIGYINQVSEAQQKKIPKAQRISARVVGQKGVELIFNKYMLGYDGGVQVEVDSLGRKLRYLKSVEPISGNNIQLNISQKLQGFVENLFVNEGATGSVVIMNPMTGEVLCMVSLPSFNPNEFSLGISQKRWHELQNAPEKVLVNKCTQGTFAPGSTFKMLVALAGLERGVITAKSTYYCPGSFTLSGQRYKCWNAKGHGNVNVTQALERSCNVFFYQLGRDLGVGAIHEYGNRLGLGRLTGIDLNNEHSGILPSEEWKKKRFNQPWFPGETINISIGQGYVTATPLQMVTYVNCLVNGGYWTQPRIFKKLIDAKGNNLAKNFQPEIQVRQSIGVSPQNLNIVKEGMRLSVNGPQGTGRRARLPNIEIGGKTGTAQVISQKTKERIEATGEDLEKRFQDHGWFVGFAPFDKPQISVVTFLENGLSGSNAAAITQKIFQFYFR